MPETPQSAVRAAWQTKLLNHIRFDGGRCSTGCAEKAYEALGHPGRDRRLNARADLYALMTHGLLDPQGPVSNRHFTLTQKGGQA